MENQNQNPKNQLIERLKQANNVLVTVSKNPSVDQLSAAIGLTLMLNQIDKHATAVFSGKVPDTLEFLKPEETIERTTDSLRDFIISLDKAKADKLRYKVEDKMVKIFITPYRTSLTDADLVFGQGDFNVDVVVAIGVHEKENLDEAITSHGRILHDATVATVNTVMSGQLGSINWVDAKASSLSEMLVPVCEGLKADTLDAQMATAFLTGIVAETARFSNEKTSSDTMNISAKLMAAGANQQLVATQLEPKPEQEEIQQEKTDVDVAEDAVADALNNDGSLEIAHENEPEPLAEPEVEQQFEDQSQNLPDLQPEQQVYEQKEHQEQQEQQEPEPQLEEAERPSRLILEPPMLGGKLTANSEPEALDPSIDPLTARPNDSPLLSHDKEDAAPEEQTEESEPEPEQTSDEVPEPEVEPQPEPEPISPPVPELEPVSPSEPVLDPVIENALPQQEDVPTLPIFDQLPAEEPLVVAEQPAPEQTLTDLEAAVDSPHVVGDMPIEPPSPQDQSTDAEAALAAAHRAFDAIGTDAPEKPAAFNASGPMEVHHDEPEAQLSEPPVAEPEPELPAEPVAVQIDPATGMLSYPTNLVPPSDVLPTDPTAGSVEDPTAAPPVPPPMPMPPFGPAGPVQLDPNNLPPIQ